MPERFCRRDYAEILSTASHIDGFLTAEDCIHAVRFRSQGVRIDARAECAAGKLCTRKNQLSCPVAVSNLKPLDSDNDSKLTTRRCRLAPSLKTIASTAKCNNASLCAPRSPVRDTDRCIRSRTAEGRLVESDVITVDGAQDSGRFRPRFAQNPVVIVTPSNYTVRRTQGLAL
jgi:hypothetical protein